MTNLPTINATEIENVSFEFRPLKKIISGIGQNFPNLKELRIVEQQLQIIEKGDFDELPQLKILNLSHNLITETSENSFDLLASLIKLDLSYCKIKSVSGNLFKNLKKLEALNLAHNQLDGKLVKEMFEHLKALRDINLEGNKIEKLGARMFINNLELRFISFKKNNIKRIEDNFTVLKHIEKIDLTGNACISTALCQGCEVLTVDNLQIKLNKKCNNDYCYKVFGHNFCV